MLDIPEEDLAVAADAGEPRVVRGDGDIEDSVAVGFVLLDGGRGLRG